MLADVATKTIASRRDGKGVDGGNAARTAARIVGEARGRLEVETGKEIGKPEII